MVKYSLPHNNLLSFIRFYYMFAIVHHKNRSKNKLKGKFYLIAASHQVHFCFKNMDVKCVI